MAAKGSIKVVIAALVGNSLIAVTKFAAAALTGSSAMFSEAIHSCVDTGNQALLLYGIRRADRPADDTHPYGYGREIYFWAFVVAILIFAVGAGVSLYEGVEKVRHPEPISRVYVNYIVLGIAMLFEAGAWWVAFKEFNSTRGNKGILEAIRVSKDPSIVTVLLEDSAAMLGLVVAFLGIFLGQIFDLPELDGVASIVIGLVLAGAAMVLAYETKGLLIGEAAHPEVVSGVRHILASQNDIILKINEILTLHQGPEDILVNISIDFHDGVPAGHIEEAISKVDVQIKKRFPLVTRIYIEAQSWQGYKRENRLG